MKDSTMGFIGSTMQEEDGRITWVCGVLVED